MVHLPEVTQEWSTPTNPDSTKFLSERGYNEDEDWLLDNFKIASSTPLLKPSGGELIGRTRYIRSMLHKFPPAFPILMFGLAIGICGIFSLFSFRRHLKPCSDHFLIMFIRHVEKNEQNGISTLGKCRAKLLPSLFNGKNFPKPQILVTYAPSVNRPSLRGIQTLLPISEKLDLDLNTWTTSQYQKMLDNILAQACGRTVLIAWHWNYPDIEDLVVELGVSQEIASRFSAKDGRNYDAVWMLSYKGENVPANLTIKLEGLGINPCQRRVV